MHRYLVVPALAATAACSRSTVGQVIAERADGRAVRFAQERMLAPPGQAVPESCLCAPVEPVDCEVVPCVSLTFDDGPDPENTPEVLRILARESVKATFFVVGRAVNEYPEQIRRMVNEGHDVENHSWDHADFTTLPADEIVDQIRRTSEAIVAAGGPPVELFRAPYGATNAAVRAHVPMPIMGWDVDPNDWKLDADPAAVTSHVVKSSSPGSIVVLHSVKSTTVEALPHMISGLRAKGFQLVPLSVLTDFPDAAAGRVFESRWIPGPTRQPARGPVPSAGAVDDDDL